MDFEWTEHEQKLRDGIAAALSEIGEAGTDRDALLAASQRLAGAGYWDVVLGPAGDGEALALAAANLEIARHSASLFAALHFSRILAGLVEALGDAALRERILGPLRAGEALGAVAISQPLDAREVEDGALALDGRAPYVANGPLADWLAVRAATGEGDERLCLVAPDDAGVTLEPRQALLGLDGLHTCAVRFEAVAVPAGRALRIADDGVLRWQRRAHDLGLAVAGAGLMQRALEAAKAHAGEHERGGRAIRKYQAVGFKLAEMLTLAQTAELLCFRAAWIISGSDAEADVVAACAKVFCSENAERVASDAIQVLAGAGVAAGTTVEQAFRDAKTLAVLGTSNEIARVNIADQLLEKY